MTSDRGREARRGGHVDLGRRLEPLVLLGIVALAALTRLPGLALRGQWDADQGHDMTVLHALVTAGQVPLLGPPTSIGTFHHGALYYYLLAPAAFLSGADPSVVVLELALIGIGAVVATWWLARVVGGPMTAAFAGLVAAVSPAAIEESTFIWNPNLVPLFAALAFGSAIRARQTRRARWWLMVGVTASVAVQAHVLDITLLIPLAGLWLDTLVRRLRRHEPVLDLVRGGVAVAVLVVAGFLPLLASELTTGFTEVRAVLLFLGGNGSEAMTALPVRIIVVGLRVLSWPLVGLVTERAGLSLLVSAVMVALIGMAVVTRRAHGDVTTGARTRAVPAGAGSRPDGRAPDTDIPAARLLAGALAISVLVLAIVAPSLAAVVPGLPNDHYHAFLDPVVLVLASVGLARLTGTIQGSGDNHRSIRVARLTGLGATLASIALAVSAWPPVVSPDGGWPGADAAAVRVLATTGDAPLALDGLPVFKSADAVGFPLLRRGAQLVADGTTGAATVVVCDPLFETVVGDTCGGVAETAWLAMTGRSDLVLADRWEAGPRRVISVYAAPAP